MALWAKRIDSELPAAEAKEVKEILVKLLTNILRDSSNQKFRSLNKSNKKLTEAIFAREPAMSMLLLAGFEDGGSVWQLPSTCPLFTAGLVVEGLAATGQYGAPVFVPNDQFKVADPRKSQGEQVTAIGFYYNGSESACDSACGASFLGNFFPSVPFRFSPPAFTDKPKTFNNAEAAYQACKSWQQHGDAFAALTGPGAIQKKKELQACRLDWDQTYAGFGSNWAAMRGVVAAKFAEGSFLSSVLLSTGDTFLVEHNDKEGRDKVWSDNAVGGGTNWLGACLMLRRDELRGSQASEESWTSFLAKSMDLASGKPHGTAWQITVDAAANLLP
jgi:predicted NAD-dependent protein-ADP-ribosyltransferase YbiA (DUF1768 family)